MAGAIGSPNRMATPGRRAFLRPGERRKSSRDAPLEPVLKGHMTGVNIVPHNQVVEARPANTKCRRGGETAVPRPRTPTPGVWTRSRRPLASPRSVRVIVIPCSLSTACARRLRACRPGGGEERKVEPSLVPSLPPRAERNRSRELTAPSVILTALGRQLVARALDSYCTRCPVLHSLSF